MYFTQLAIGGYDKNLSYFIGDDTTREVMVVDPDNLEMLEGHMAANNLVLKGIIITHEHHDHVVGVSDMVAKYDAPVFIHPAARHAVEASGGEIQEINDGDEISIGGVSVKVMHTPGHAHGAVCLYAEGKLITGDTLFVGGCGRCDLATSDVDLMYVSLFEKIWALPDETEIYPGHDYGDTPFSTLGHEKKTNRFLVCEGKEAFVRERMS